MPNSSSCRSCGLISTTRLSSPRSINMRRASGGSARRRAGRRQVGVVRGWAWRRAAEGPAAGSAPQRRGAVRAGSLAAGGGGGGDGERRAGGGVDRRLPVRGVLVARVDCRVVGMAAAGRRRAAHRNGSPSARFALGARGAVGAAQSVLVRRGGARVSVRSRSAVGWIAGRAAGASWAAAGVLYAGALVASVGLLRASLRASAWPRSSGSSRSFGEQTSPPISPAG